jgi:hypothetical protein
MFIPLVGNAKVIMGRYSFVSLKMALCYLYFQSIDKDHAGSHGVLDNQRGETRGVLWVPE